MGFKLNRWCQDVCIWMIDQHQRSYFHESYRRVHCNKIEMSRVACWKGFASNHNSIIITGSRVYLYLPLSSYVSSLLLCLSSLSRTFRIYWIIGRFSGSSKYISSRSKKPIQPLISNSPSNTSLSSIAWEIFQPQSLWSIIGDFSPPNCLHELIERSLGCRCRGWLVRNVPVWFMMMWSARCPWPRLRVMTIMTYKNC